MKYFVLGLLVSVSLVACNGSGDSGNVDEAHKAALSAPKSVDALPANMPESAKASAAAGIEQGKAAQAEAASRNHAMEEMAKQRGH